MNDPIGARRPRHASNGLLLKAAVVIPDVLISSLLWLVIIAALTPVAGLTLMAAGITFGALFAAGVGEDASVRVLYRARRATPAEAPRLTVAWRIAAHHLDGDGVRLRIVNGGTPVATAGRRHLLLRRDVVDAYCANEINAHRSPRSSPRASDASATATPASTCSGRSGPSPGTSSAASPTRSDAASPGSRWSSSPGVPGSSSAPSPSSSKPRPGAGRPRSSSRGSSRSATPSRSGDGRSWERRCTVWSRRAPAQRRGQLLGRGGFKIAASREVRTDLPSRMHQHWDAAREALRALGRPACSPEASCRLDPRSWYP